MTTLTIHFQSPPADPLKIPRPIHVEFNADGFVIVTTGGELGNPGQFVGVSKTKTPREFQPPGWFPARTMLDEEARSEVKGFNACFMDDRGIYTLLQEIDRIEVSA
jgi:hypothetical protein